MGKFAKAVELPSEVFDRPLAIVENTQAWQMRLEKLFEDGVLHDEQNRPRGVNKWQRPIELTLRGDAASDAAHFVQNIMAELSAITGLQFALHVNADWAGNVDVFVTYWKHFWPDFMSPADPNVKAFTCAAVPWIDEGHFRRARIRINAGVVGPDNATACLAEEIVQSLGLLGEVSNETATILNDEIGYRGLGEIDTLLLKVLYDPRMMPGISNDHAMEIARLLIAEQLAAIPQR